MRIGMIAKALPQPTFTGGVSGQVHLLADELVRRGHRVTVFALTPPPPGAAYQYVPIFGAPRNVTKASGLLMPYRVWFLDFDAFDLVHAHGDDHALRTKRPVVRTFYGLSSDEARHARRFRHRTYYAAMALFERLSERRADAVVTLSNQSRHALHRSAEVIPAGFDPQVFFPGNSRSAHPSVLFVGDLGTRKRADLLLNKFETEVLSAVPEAELWMVTSERPEGKNVRWLGRLTTEQLVDAYRRAWVFCLPSSYEGFGVPYVEAMACGTPVVATMNGGADDVLEGGNYGMLVEPRAVGAAIVTLLKDHQVRSVFAEKSLERARSFAAGDMAAAYEHIYERLVETPAGGC